MNHNRLMLARLIAFCVWALAAGSVVFWALRLGVQPAGVPGHALSVTSEVSNSAAVVRMLGGATVVASASAAPEPALASRFRLIGVMAPQPGATGSGVALIAVDGKPGKPYALGGQVEGELVLQSLTHRTAAIGPSGAPAVLTLELPLLPPPQTGSLPAAGAAAGAPAAVVPPPAPPVQQAAPSQPPPGAVVPMPAGTPGPARQ